MPSDSFVRPPPRHNADLVVCNAVGSRFCQCCSGSTAPKLLRLRPEAMRRPSNIQTKGRGGLLGPACIPAAPSRLAARERTPQIATFRAGSARRLVRLAAGVNGGLHETHRRVNLYPCLRCATPQRGSVVAVQIVPDLAALRGSRRGLRPVGVCKDVLRWLQEVCEWVFLRAVCLHEVV